jgi:hypothetical protein
MSSRAPLVRLDTTLVKGEHHANAETNRSSRSDRKGRPARRRRACGAGLRRRSHVAFQRRRRGHRRWSGRGAEAGRRRGRRGHVPREGATEFFTASARNLQEVGKQAGVRRIVVVSIIGTDRFTAGYGAAKVVHERATLSGPIPARILRAAQFHEFVPELIEWGRKGDVSYLPKMRTQVVAARTVAEALVDMATDSRWNATGPIPEIAGPREENLVEIARLFVTRRGDPVRIEEVSDPSYPDSHLNESGGLLPGPHATLAGPTFEEWLDSASATKG